MHNYRECTLQNTPPYLQIADYQYITPVSHIFAYFDIIQSVTKLVFFFTKLFISINIFVLKLSNKICKVVLNVAKKWSIL